MYTSRLKFLWFTHILGRARGLAFLDRRPCPFRVRTDFHSDPFYRKKKPYNVRWKSLTVICKQCKRAAANVFLRIHTTRDERIKLKRKNTTNQPSNEQLATTNEEYRRTRDHRPATKKKQHHMEIITLKRTNQPTKEEKEQNAHKNSSKKQTFLLWKKKNTGRKINKKHSNPLQ